MVATEHGRARGNASRVILGPGTRTQIHVVMDVAGMAEHATPGAVTPLAAVFSQCLPVVPAHSNPTTIEAVASEASARIFGSGLVFGAEVPAATFGLSQIGQYIVPAGTLAAHPEQRNFMLCLPSPLGICPKAYPSSNPTMPVNYKDLIQLVNAGGALRPNCTFTLRQTRITRAANPQVKACWSSSSALISRPSR